MSFVELVSLNVVCFIVHGPVKAVGGAITEVRPIFTDFDTDFAGR